MARKVVTIYTDDLTGEDTDEVSTHTFAIDGVNYEIDLAPDSFDQFLSAMGPFVNKARKTGRTQRAGAAAKRAPQTVDTARIRQWAKENGYEVNERGRVPANVREAYEKAH
ncbi:MULTISPECIES: Lsr2 family protein [unclassified Streptomyces]|uniref:Lsr2 family protein n=1 Tax=Streptomyces johnsoniae TaxID=3075532 RepID=A0ABU2S7G0_9ACTN|nr:MULTISPECIES: Lsr2 family protein [unclassified Streptomyces]MDT0444349.1 Lsr2 family protein [Streptomyces sp. DSM 41886]ONK09858.1 Nucleoid-associated protein Lsr2 [Streptomyces sp. MP131-18]